LYGGVGPKLSFKLFLTRSQVIQFITLYECHILSLQGQPEVKTFRRTTNGSMCNRRPGLPTFFPISEIVIFECVVDPLLLIDGETKIQKYLSGGHNNAIRQFRLLWVEG
jgi:hypothetical protein